MQLTAFSGGTGVLTFHYFTKIYATKREFLAVIPVTTK